MLIFPIQSKDLGVMHPIGFQSSYELFSSTREISPAVLLCLTHQSTEFAQRIFTSFLQRCRARELDSDLNALVKHSSLELWKKRQFCAVNCRAWEEWKGRMVLCPGTGTKWLLSKPSSWNQSLLPSFSRLFLSRVLLQWQGQKLELWRSEVKRIKMKLRVNDSEIKQ